MGGWKVTTSVESALRHGEAQHTVHIVQLRVDACVDEVTHDFRETVWELKSSKRHLFQQFSLASTNITPAVERTVMRIHSMSHRVPVILGPGTAPRNGIAGAIIAIGLAIREFQVTRQAISDQAIATAWHKSQWG